MPLKINDVASLTISHLAGQLRGEAAKAELRGDKGVLWVKDKSHLVSRASAQKAHREAAYLLLRQALLNDLVELGGEVPANKALAERVVKSLRPSDLCTARKGDGKAEAGSLRVTVSDALYLREFMAQAGSLLLQRGQTFATAVEESVKTFFPDAGFVSTPADVNVSVAVFENHPAVPASPQSPGGPLTSKTRVVKLHQLQSAPQPARGTVALVASQLPPGPVPTPDPPQQLQPDAKSLQPPGPPPTPDESVDDAASAQPLVDAGEDNWNKARHAQLPGRDGLFRKQPRAEFFPDHLPFGTETAQEQQRDWTVQGVNLSIGRGVVAAPAVITLEQAPLLDSKSVDPNILLDDQPTMAKLFIASYAKELAALSPVAVASGAVDRDSKSAQASASLDEAHWLSVAKWLCQPHPRPSSARPHLVDRAQLQQLPLDQRVNLLLALANNIERVRTSGSVSAIAMREAYVPYLHLAGAFSDAELMPQSERLMLQSFMSGRTLAQFESLWNPPVMGAGTQQTAQRLQAFANRVSATADAYAQGGVKPSLTIEPTARLLGWQPGATPHCASGAMVFAGKTDFKNEFAHVLKGLGCTRQQQLVQLARAEKLPGDDAGQVQLARILAALNKAPIESQWLQDHAGMTQRKARDAERSGAAQRQLAAAVDLVFEAERRRSEHPGSFFDWLKAPEQ